MPGVLLLPHMGPHSSKLDPPTGDGATQGGTICAKPSLVQKFTWQCSRMLSKLNWISLETRRKQSHLLLLFKLLNHLVYIPKNLLPVYSPSGITRASYSIQLIRPYAGTNIYLNSFFPCTISDWKKLHIATLTNVSIEEFKNILANLFWFP